MDVSKLHRSEALGVAAALLLLLSLFLLTWYDLSTDVVRSEPDDWICGVGETTCSGFDTFPILRWLLILGAAAPLILAWIVVRDHDLSWPPGELTMIVGFTAFVLIAYNGIIDRPGSGGAESGVGLSVGYWVALLAAVGIAAAGFWRSSVSQTGQTRKAPGTV